MEIIIAEFKGLINTFYIIITEIFLVKEVVIPIIITCPIIMGLAMYSEYKIQDKKNDKF